jgi:hypothetical protein
MECARCACSTHGWMHTVECVDSCGLMFDTAAPGAVVPRLIDVAVCGVVLLQVMPSFTLDFADAINHCVRQKMLWLVLTAAVSHSSLSLVDVVRWCGVRSQLAVCHRCRTAGLSAFTASCCLCCLLPADTMVSLVAWQLISVNSEGW